MNIDDVTKEAQITNFDEARQAAENTFNGPEQIEQEPVIEEQPQVQETEATQIAPEASETEQALEVAEIAAQKAVQSDTQLQEVLGRLQALESENSTLKQTMQQQNQQVKEQVIEDIMQPPTLDINSLLYDDEETAAGKVNEYTNGILSFAEKEIMKKISPYIQEAEEAKKQNEKSEVVNSLSQVPELPGFKELLPQIENIVSTNPIFKNATDLGEAYINAYAIAKGVSTINTPKQETTPEQLIEMINSNPEAQKLYEQLRVQKVQNNQQVPPLSASSGAVNAAPNIPKRVETFEDARKRTEEMFNMNY